MSRPPIPPWSQAIRMKCHDCMARYQDGRHDCGLTRCPLYHWMPFAEGEADLWWTDYSPRAVGLRTKADIFRGNREQARQVIERVNQAGVRARDGQQDAGERI